MKKPVIFTDMDGTLLDHLTYSFEGAEEALSLIKEKNIPLIICSSKTRPEIEHYRRLLHNTHPFISENGGGVFIPDDYFSSDPGSLGIPLDHQRGYTVIRLGAPYNDLRSALEKIRSEGYPVKGFGDMNADEIASLTRLSVTEAQLAKERDFDEVFTYTGPVEELPSLFASITRKGYTYTQGYLFHILGNTDKGKAVNILISLYRKQFGDISTIAIGDSLNDNPMFERVDQPVLVRKPDGGYDLRINVPGLHKADGIGPVGWNKAVLSLLT